MILHWIDTTIKYGWWLIACADVYLRWVEPHRRRMRRGKAYAWEMRTFGPFGVVLGTFMVISMAITESAVFGTRWVADAFWIYIAVCCAIDWLTGDDDPPWKRYSEKAKKLLERLKPIPEPAIDLGGKSR